MLDHGHGDRNVKRCIFEREISFEQICLDRADVVPPISFENCIAFAGAVHRRVYIAVLTRIWKPIIYGRHICSGGLKRQRGNTVTGAEVNNSAVLWH